MASSTSREGSRSPRSICDRYGLEMPTSCANWRMDSSLSSRWRRMYSPSALGTATPRSASAHHPGADRVVRALVDEDEGAHRAHALVGLRHDLLAEAQPHAADVVEREGLGRRPVERGEVELALDDVHARPHRAG